MVTAAECGIVFSPRRRRPAFRIAPETGRLELLLPAGFPEHRIPILLEENAPAIGRLFARCERRSARIPRFEFNENGRFLYLGEWKPLRFSRRVSAFDGETFLVPAGSPEEVRESLEKLYRKLALNLFSARVAHYAQRHGLSPGKISINAATGRWGSCSSGGNLHFSWRLLQCPPPAVDYVIVHELAHLRELNHSPRFWAVVRSMEPDYEIQNRFLARHGLEYRGW